MTMSPISLSAEESPYSNYLYQPISKSIISRVPELRIKMAIFSFKGVSSKRGRFNDTCTGGAIELHIDSICLIS